MSKANKNKWFLKAAGVLTYWPTRGQAEAAGEMQVAKCRAMNYVIGKVA